MENQRIVTLLFIIGGVLIGIFCRSAISALLVAQAWEDPIVAGLATTSTVVGIVGGIVGFFILLRNAQALAFTDSVVAEMRKVAWPTKEETVNNATIVVGSALFFAILLAVYDFIWAKVTGLFLYTV